MLNNPRSRADPDGHCCWAEYAQGAWQGTKNFVSNTVQGTAQLVRAGQGDVGAAISVGQGLVKTGGDVAYVVGHTGEVLSSLPAGWVATSAQDKASMVTEYGLASAVTLGGGVVGAEAAGGADAAGMARSLSSETGIISVEFSTESSVGRIDLTGKAHFDKASGESIPTPHVHEQQINVGPNGKSNLGAKTTRPATAGDVKKAAQTIKKDNQ